MQRVVFVAGAIVAVEKQRWRCNLPDPIARRSTQGRGENADAGPRELTQRLYHL